MIDPIGNNLSAIINNPALPATERPARQSEPSVRVTGGEEVHTNGSSTSQPHARALEDTPFGEQASTLEKALDTLNNTLQAWSTGMRFDIDEDAQRVVISIVDNGTGEVLRTVPSDAVLRVAKMIVQLQGTTVDTKA